MAKADLLPKVGSYAKNNSSPKGLIFSKPEVARVSGFLDASQNTNTSGAQKFWIFSKKQFQTAFVPSKQQQQTTKVQWDP